MKALKYITIIVLSLLTLSCESLYFEEEPANNPVALFEDLWNTFNTSYANFFTGHRLTPALPRMSFIAFLLKCWANLMMLT